jgi:hypothetical protein
MDIKNNEEKKGLLNANLSFWIAVPGFCLISIVAVMAYLGSAWTCGFSKQLFFCGWQIVLGALVGYVLIFLVSLKRK